MMEQRFLADIVPMPPVSIEILDIGAAELEADRYQCLTDQGIAKVTGFEPNPDELNKLRRRDGNRVYLPYFLGDGTKRRFYWTRFPGCSSLFRPDPAVIDRFATISAGSALGDFTVREEIDVDTVRLDDIALPLKPDYAKVDVQGAELMVMENGVETLSDAVVLETEVEFVPIYENQPLFGGVQSFMSEHGFVLHKMIDIAGRGLEPVVNPANPFLPVSQVLWADAVFVKDYFRTDGFSDEQLAKAAIVLHDVYRSYDLVYLLLDELGRRTGDALSAAYGEYLVSGKAPTPECMTIRGEP